MSAGSDDVFAPGDNLSTKATPPALKGKGKDKGNGHSAAVGATGAAAVTAAGSSSPGSSPVGAPDNGGIRIDALELTLEQLASAVAQLQSDMETLREAHVPVMDSNQGQLATGQRLRNQSDAGWQRTSQQSTDAVHVRPEPDGDASR